MTRYGAFELYTHCDHCGKQLPVNGPVRELTCSHCRRRYEVPASAAAAPLRDLEEAELSQGEALEVTSTGWEVGILQSRVVWDTPTCRKCGEPLAVGEVEVGSEGTATCGCGEVWATFPAPEWLRRAVPTARQIVDGLRSAAGGAEAEVRTDRLVGMKCPGCGGPLELGPDVSRIHPCPYCRTHVFLPDDVWSRLHPAQVVRRWYVRFEAGPGRSPGGDRRQSDSCVPGR